MIFVKTLIRRVGFFPVFSKDSGLRSTSKLFFFAVSFGV